VIDAIKPTTMTTNIAVFVFALVSVSRLNYFVLPIPFDRQNLPAVTIEANRRNPPSTVKDLATKRHLNLEASSSHVFVDSQNRDSKAHSVPNAVDNVPKSKEISNENVIRVLSAASTWLPLSSVQPHLKGYISRPSLMLLPSMKQVPKRDKHPHITVSTLTSRRSTKKYHLRKTSLTVTRMLKVEQKMSKSITRRVASRNHRKKREYLGTTQSSDCLGTTQSPDCGNSDDDSSYDATAEEEEMSVTTDETQI
jgi:hypothetical protein